MTRTFTAHRRQLTALRLSAQAIVAGDDRPGDPAATVRRLLCMQAQDFAGAKWSVGLRTPGSTDASIEASLAAGDIVRSWPMRGTLHFVPPQDLGWILSLTADRIISSTAGRERELQLTAADFATARDVAEENLSGGRVLTRDELLAGFVAAGVATTGQRGVHLLQRLCLERVAVFGPLQGKKHTFALFDDWVRSPRVLEREEGLGEFAARYFAAHGPATVRDFAWWSSLTLTDARVGVAVVRDRLDELDIEGAAYYLDRDTAAAASATVALPGFDEYLLGYQDRSPALAAEHAKLVVPGGNGLFLPTIVVDGEVVGLWRRTITRAGVAVEARPFGELSMRARSRFDAATGRYARFLGLPLLPEA